MTTAKPEVAHRSTVKRCGQPGVPPSDSDSDAIHVGTISPSGPNCSVSMRPEASGGTYIFSVRGLAQAVPGGCVQLISKDSGSSGRVYGLIVSAQNGPRPKNLGWGNHPSTSIPKLGNG